MKLLFDQNLSFRLCRQLQDVFPGSKHVAAFGLSRADDRRVWEAAKAGGFTLVSHDADLAEMALLLGPPPKVVWLRCGNRPSAFLAELLRRYGGAIDAFGADPELGCLELYG